MLIDSHCHLDHFGPEEQPLLIERAAEVGATVAREGMEFGVVSRVPAVGGQMLALQGLRGQYDDVFLPLYGAHQAQNAAVALAAVRNGLEATVLERRAVAGANTVLAPGSRIGPAGMLAEQSALGRDEVVPGGRTWAGSRLRDRIDAIIVHELAEGDAGSHEEALALASRTGLPISEASRRILRVMELGWRGRS